MSEFDCRQEKDVPRFRLTSDCNEMEEEDVLEHYHDLKMSHCFAIVNVPITGDTLQHALDQALGIWRNFYIPRKAILVVENALVSALDIL